MAETKKKNSFWSLISDYKRNTVLLTLPSIPFDIIYGIFCFLVGFFTMSVWLMIMSFYHFIICTMRINILYRGARGKLSKNKKFSDRVNYLKFSRNLILFDIFLAVTMRFIYNNRIEHDYPGYILYIFMAYVIYKVLLSIINIFRANRAKSLIIVSLRKIGVSDSIVSILILQWALVRTNGSFLADLSRSVEAYIGIAALIIIFLMGIAGLITCSKMKKQERLEQTNNT